MLSIAQAIEQILSHCRPAVARDVALDESLGCVLGEDVTSDIDSPPHDKAMVDGYAVIANDLRSLSHTTGTAELALLEEVTAGEVPKLTVIPGHCTRVMTGAPVPLGADAMVMVEETSLVAGNPGAERIALTRPAKIGQNIMRRATSLAKGDVVIHRGTRIRPIELGVLAEVGRICVLTHPRPRVAILSTGNELVPVDAVPAAGQIRNSNGPMLAAQVTNAGARPVPLGVAKDDPQSLRTLISAGLACDVLVLSGGVSAGVLDLVPSVLRELGVREVFHKVQLKPGKPLWFGVIQTTDDTRLVFGLPGNPVSSLVCFELFVRPALEALAGLSPGTPREEQAKLSGTFAQRGDRPTLFPGRLHHDAQGQRVAPIAWKGSADLASLVQANCLIHFPAGERSFAVGEMVPVVRL